MTATGSDVPALKFIPHAPQSLPSFKGATLLVASVTIGNVPQLAVDLLLSSTPAKSMGRLQAPALLPFAGVSEDGARILTGAEVYLASDVALLQHHAPPARGRASEHARGVIGWAQNAGFTQVLILSSANAAGRRDAQLRDASERTRARIVRGSYKPEQATCADRALAGGGTLLEGVDERGVWRDAEYPDGAADGIAFLPLVRPASFVRAALDAAADARIPTTLLLAFAHEGENSADAAALAARAAHAASIPVNGAPAVDDSNHPQPDVLLRCFTAPKSWYALAPPPAGLY